MSTAELSTAIPFRAAYAQCPASHIDTMDCSRQRFAWLVRTTCECAVGLAHMRAMTRPHPLLQQNNPDPLSGTGPDLRRDSCDLRCVSRARVRWGAAGA